MQYCIANRGAASADIKLRFKVAEALADILVLRGRYDRAGAQLEAARSFASDDFSLARVQGKCGDLFFKQGDMVGATSCLEQAICLLRGSLPRGRLSTAFFLLRELSVQVLHTLFPRVYLARFNETGDDQFTLIRLYRRLTYPYFFARSRWHCLCVQLRAMNLAERYPASAELAATYSDHAATISIVPYYSRAFVYAQKSLDIRRNLRDLWGQGNSLHFYGVALYSAAKFDECITRCQDAIELFERVGDYWEINIARYLVAMSMCRLGRNEEAAQIATEMYESGVQLGDVQATAMSLEPWAQRHAKHFRLVTCRGTESSSRRCLVEIVCCVGIYFLPDGEGTNTRNRSGAAVRVRRNHEVRHHQCLGNSS